MKGRVRKSFVYLAMFILVLVGYSTFYNTINFGDKPNVDDWSCCSTVKFVNSWLKDGAYNVHFLMLERPASIEYTNLQDRYPYISYPPGTVVPPYLLAKVLHKDQIQIDFVRQFLIFKYFIDTFLVCLIFFGILTYFLRIRHVKWAALISVVLSISWMCLPINFLHLRNVYFSDSAVITVVLLFIWMEIYEALFRNKSMPVQSLYFILKFFIILAGVWVDYYFLFVVFVAWLIKIAPAFKLREKKISSIVLESLVYVLPVLVGLALFVLQISTVTGFMSKTENIIGFRTFSSYSEHWNLTVVAKRFVRNYSLIGVLLLVVSLVWITKFMLSKSKIRKVNLPIIKISLLILIPPVLHVLIFQQHSAQHEVSILKFALPFICTLFIFLWYFLRRYKNTMIIYPAIITGIIGTATLTNIFYFNNYYQRPQPFNQDLPSSIREHWKYEDVYFSFTDSIVHNPPISLSISNKSIYKIDDISDIKGLFPNLDPKAQILFVIRKDNIGKSNEIIEKEDSIIANSTMLFESENYKIFDNKKR